MSTKDPSAVVVPFGKHRGTTVAELLTKDPQYAEWLLAQGWLADRFAELHAAILTRGAGTDDSPEHNAIQVRFLDHQFRTAFALACSIDLQVILDRKIRITLNDRQCNLEEATRHRQNVGWEGAIPRADRELLAATQKAAEPIEFRLVSAVQFEHRGIDAVIGIAWVAPDSKLSNHDLLSPHIGLGQSVLNVEIKPSMGEDYPTVMRQMRRLGSIYLLVGEYSGRAVSLPQLRQMFTANGQMLVTMQDVEAEIANARALISSDEGASIR